LFIAFTLGNDEALIRLALYGQWPSLILDGDNDFNKGRMIPTTSVEQIGATIAKWMGVTSDSAMDYIFPNLANFTVQDLGFLRV